MIITCMTGLSVTSSAADITTWAELQAALSAGGTVTLTQDITAAPDDTGLVIPAGMSVALDLAGRMIHRGLSSAQADGYVIRNEGTLTIKDSGVVSGGSISGGYNTGSGGGIHNAGTLVFEGGSIVRNKAASGGGIYNSGSLTLSGGMINGNSADDNGGGVYLQGGGFIIKNGSRIALHGNTANGTENNVYLPSGKTITVTDVPATDSMIGVTTEVAPTAGRPVPITGVYSSDSCTFFTSDNPAYSVGKIGGIAYLYVGELLTPWKQLQKDMAVGGEITLTQNVTAEADDTALVVPEDKTVTLDLNGYTIDRALTAPAEDGSVIFNYGTLTIKDSGTGGKITGGNYSDVMGGGGIHNRGTLALTGGTISGNTAQCGGGIVNSNSGIFTMSGGTISGNTADGSYGGGGVFNCNIFTMSGGTISGNTTTSSGGGIYNRGGELTLTGGTVSGNICGAETDISVKIPAGNCNRQYQTQCINNCSRQTQQFCSVVTTYKMPCTSGTY